MTDIWRVMPVAGSASLLLAPGEHFGGLTEIRLDTWALVIGESGVIGFTVLYGSRDEIVKLLRDAQEEIDNSYGAEHENALHTEYEGRCPTCQAHGPTQTCDAEGSYTRRDHYPLSSVRSGKPGITCRDCDQQVFLLDGAVWASKAGADCPGGES